MEREGFESPIAGIPQRRFSKAVPESYYELNQQELASIPFRVLPSSLPFANEIDSELAPLIEAWPNLSLPIRRAILALIKFDC